MLKPPLYATLMAVVFTCGSVQAFDHGIPLREVSRIMEHTNFRVVYRISAIPLKPLVASKFLPPNRPLSTFLVDPGQPFQSGTHADIDPDRPERQLIFAALSPDYLVLCFWIGDWPADVRYMMVIRRDGSKAKQAFYCTIDGEANTLKDVRRLLRKGQVSILGVS